MSDLHKAYLGLSGRDFELELAAIPRSSIDQVDARGRTLLSWASQRGDENTVSRLLAAGANPDKACIDGMTALHQSLYATSTDCMRCLLAAKADIEAKNIVGRTSLQLSAKIISGPQFSKVLVAHGASLETTDMYGWGALHYASHRNHHEQVSHLLQEGVNINAQTYAGKTALLLALAQNCHSVLGILFGHPGLDSSLVDTDGRGLMFHAALFGDLGTLEMLENACIYDVDIETLDIHGSSSMWAAQWRRDLNADWAKKFVQLPDEDPVLWFKTFLRLYDGIRKRQEWSSQSSIHNVLSGTESSDDDNNLENWDDTSEVESDEDDSDQDEWEDAPEAVAPDL